MFVMGKRIPRAAKFIGQVPILKSSQVKLNHISSLEESVESLQFKLMYLESKISV